MSHLIEFVFSSELLSYLAKATLVLAAAWAVTAGMRRATAAARELVWRMGLAGALALPVLAVAVPPIALDVARPVPAIGSDPATHATGTLLPRDVERATALTADGAELAGIALAPIAAGTTTSGLDVRHWITPLWILGALLCLWPLVRGLFTARRIVSGARPTLDPAWLRARDEAAVALGIGTEVELRTATDLKVPFVWHPLPCMRPLLIVPEAEAMPRAIWRRSALLHELAHVTRNDGPTQLIARFAVSTLWPVPLAWHALRALRLEAERASDGVVLSAGHRPSEYAAQLVDLAVRIPQHSQLPVVAMTSGGDLRRRVTTILDREASHAPVHPRKARIAAGLALAALLPVAALRAQASAPSNHGDTTAQEVDDARGWGLQALVAAQDTSGAWRGDVGYKLNSAWRITSSDVPHVGVTALALQALVGAVQPDVFAAPIQLGRRFLIDNQGEDGFISAHGTRMRAHALATRALAELLSAAPEDSTRAALENAAGFIVRQQNAQGGWRFVPGSADSDVLETVYQLRALVAARREGVQVPDATLSSALAYVSRARVTQRDSPVLDGYLFQPTPGSRVTANTTAAGLYVLAHSSNADASALESTATRLGQLHAQRIERHPEHFLAWDADELTATALRAAARHDNAVLRDSWAEWRDAAHERLISQQRSDGTWPCSEGTGVHWSTAMACLVLAQD